MPDELEIRDLIKSYTEKIKNISDEQKEQQRRLNKIIKFKKILYEADDVLEEAVKESFEEFGLSLDKKGDMDWVYSSDSRGAILEVTGSESSIDVVKFRQLLNYLLNDMQKTGEEKKAILVGNHFLNDPPDKRGLPFTEKAIGEAELHSICLLPTTELYEIICNIREKKASKIEMWKALLRTDGLFTCAL